MPDNKQQGIKKQAKLTNKRAEGAEGAGQLMRSGGLMLMLMLMLVLLMLRERQMGRRVGAGIGD